MEEDTKQLRLFIGGFLALVLTIASCTSYETTIDNAAIVEMVKSGADPLSAKCAVGTDAATCGAAAAKR